MNNMPKVKAGKKVKKFTYTKKGISSAKKMAKMSGGKMMMKMK